MTIATYAELKIAVANWLGRDDIADARISEFVVMFEAVANRALRVRQMEATATLAISSGSAALPADFLSPISIERTDDFTPLENVTPAWAQAAFPEYTTGRARYYAIRGANVIVYPQETDSFSLAYFGKIPALSDSATTNWLLLAHPDLYLFGSLVESEMFLVNDERALSWKSRRDELFEELRQLSNKSRGVGRVRLVQATP